MKVKVSAMGAIKEVTDVLSVVPLVDVDSLEVKRFGLTGVMEISAGGSSFKLEGKPGDMKELATSSNARRPQPDYPFVTRSSGGDRGMRATDVVGLRRTSGRGSRP